MTEERALAWLGEQTDRLTRLSSRFPVLSDLSTAIVILAVSLAGLHVQNRLGAQSIVLGALLCLPLLLHRRSPVGTLALVAVVALVQWLTSVPQLADAAVLLALYWVAREARMLWVIGAAAVVEAGAVMAAVQWSPSDSLKVWVGLTGLAIAATVSGITVRQRRALFESLQERAAQLEFERDQEGRLSAAAERARIAREMHDIVSHNLTVMIALADGATYAMESAPEQAKPALERISATGRQALVEMRRLLGVLRDEPSPGSLEPQPSLARLDELLTQIEAAGIPVSVTVEGDPTSLSDGIQLTVFRVAQEALTNTLKHAVAPREAHVALRCSGSVVELEVTDDGRAGADETPRAGRSAGTVGAGSELGSATAVAKVEGRGLRGMQERALAYGGTLEAGPLPDGGWQVRLRISA